MTTVRVRFTPNGTPTPGQISFVLRHDEGNRPIASGRDILNGPGEWVPVPVEGADVEVRPNDPGTHYVVKVRAGNDPQQTATFTIPPNGPINFGDLVRYDPKAGMAYEPDPDWWAHLSAVENGINGVQADLHEARNLAQTSANTAAEDAATAQTAASQAQSARDQTVALGITVDTSAGRRVMVGDTVISYDSGWRVINDALAIETSGPLRILIRRINNVVYFSADFLTVAAPVGGNSRLVTIPHGFAPDSPVRAGSGATYELSSGVYSSGSALSVREPVATGNRRFYMSWAAHPTYPTILPGTPA